MVFSVRACGGRGASSLTSQSQGATRWRQAGGRTSRQSKTEARTRRRGPEAERGA